MKNVQSWLAQKGYWARNSYEGDAISIRKGGYEGEEAAVVLNSVWIASWAKGELEELIKVKLGI